MTDTPAASNDAAETWEARYRAGQTGWDRGEPSPALFHWLGRGLPAGGRVLVPGCGRGHEVVALASRGFQVTAIDTAPSAVAHLRIALAQHGVAATVVEADLLHWSPERPFDAVYEQTCLCALAPAHWPRYAQLLYAWLAPGGLLLASFMQTHCDGGPPYHCDPGAMRALFSPPRWRWLEDTPVQVPHSPGLVELAFVIERGSAEAAS